MQRISAMSVVVKAQGVSAAVYNGQRDRVVEAVRAEAETRVEQAKAETERARDWAQMQEKKCSRLQRANVDAFLERQNSRPGMIRRMGNAAAVGWACAWVAAGRARKAAARAVELAWCYFWGITCALGLWEYVGDEKD